MQWYRDPSTNSNLDTDHMKLKEVMKYAVWVGRTGFLKKKEKAGALPVELVI
jgi:hypothetical protein